MYYAIVNIIHQSLTRWKQRFKQNVICKKGKYSIALMGRLASLHVALINHLSMLENILCSQKALNFSFGLNV